MTDDPENKAIWNSSPVLFVHLACLAVFFVGVSWTAVAVCFLTYAVRVFALTAGYHRYFSHRSFKTSRFFQFVLGFVGASSAQLGPLWWAAHHRHHHGHSDTEDDLHSPQRHGFYWSHIGWVLCRDHFETHHDRVRDFGKYPEIMLLDRYHVIAPAALVLSLIGLGFWLEAAYPGLGTSPWQLLVWGFFISTVLVYHVTFCVNSVTHMYGRKRFKVQDESRNLWWVALLTGGEGWHNNHHRYPASARQGFYWWEFDITYYVLRLMAVFGLVWDLRPVPERVLEQGRQPLPADP